MSKDKVAQDVDILTSQVNGTHQLQYFILYNIRYAHKKKLPWALAADELSEPSPVLLPDLF